MSNNLKKELMSQLITNLENNLNSIVSSALEAKAAATNVESKPENKYDTRGLEASYLAGAQAERTANMKKEIDHLKRLELKSFSAKDLIDLTAIIKVLDDSDSLKNFLLLTYGGGTKLEIQDEFYFVITPKSPMGAQIFRKKTGDTFTIKNKEKINEYEIIEVL